MRTEDLAARPLDEGAILPKRPELREAFFYCLRVWLVARVALTILAVTGVALLQSLKPVGVPGWAAPEQTGGWHNLVTPWERFDGLWFLRIADSGYVDGDGSAAFFPLYPLAIRALSWVLGGHPLAAALIISNAAFLGALVVLYLLTHREFGETMARRTVLYMTVFPTAFFFFAPYSESLFLFLIVTSLYAARRGSWPVAGVAGALAGATRNVGILLVPVLAAEAVVRWRRERRPIVAPLVWSAFASVGALAYLAFWQRFAGDWTVPIAKQQNWLREGSFPLWTIGKASREAFRFIGVYPGGYHLLDWLIVVPALLGAIWVARRTPAPYGVYTWASLLAPLSFIFVPRPFMSVPRFLLPVFPLAWALARFSERFKANEAVVAVCAAGLGLFTVLFVNWYYIF
jgi:hypothetical protein